MELRECFICRFVEDVLQEEIQLLVRLGRRRVARPVGHGDAILLAEEPIDRDGVVQRSRRSGGSSEPPETRNGRGAVAPMEFVEVMPGLDHPFVGTGPRIFGGRHARLAVRPGSQPRYQGSQ